jgi:hypothetical protein
MSVLVVVWAYLSFVAMVSMAMIPFNNTKLTFVVIVLLTIGVVVYD